VKTLTRFGSVGGVEGFLAVIGIRILSSNVLADME